MLRGRLLILALLLLVGCNSDPQTKIKDLQKADLLARERALSAPSPTPSPTLSALASPSSSPSKQQKKGGSNYELLTKIELSPAENASGTENSAENETSESIAVLPSPSPSPSPTAVSLTDILEEAATEEPQAPQFGSVGEKEQGGDVVINQPGNRNSNLLGGVVTRSPTPSPTVSDSDEDSDDPLDDDDASPSPSPTELLVGPARGYTLLTLMQPNARQSVERQLQTLIDARIKNLYLGVLTDGTFAKDFEYLALVIRTLVGAGRNLTLALYLTNGATMRDFEDTPIRTSFSQIDPAEFRELIREDQGIREKFRNLVREVKPIFELNRRLSPQNQNIAIMMLEDNLNGEAYVAMREMAFAELGNLVSYIRNPCPGCYEGNDTESFGDGIELHQVEGIYNLGQRDGFSLDGIGFSLAPSGTELSVNQVAELINIATQRGLRYFGLWKAARQGLGSGLILDPDQRAYQVPTDEEMEVEARLLGVGL